MLADCDRTRYADAVEAQDVFKGQGLGREHIPGGVMMIFEEKSLVFAAKQGGLVDITTWQIAEPLQLYGLPECLRKSVTNRIQQCVVEGHG